MQRKEATQGSALFVQPVPLSGSPTDLKVGWVGFPDNLLQPRKGGWLSYAPMLLCSYAYCLLLITVMLCWFISSPTPPCAAALGSS